jgi:hypothetical protein
MFTKPIQFTLLCIFTILVFTNGKTISLRKAEKTLLKGNIPLTKLSVAEAKSKVSTLQKGLFHHSSNSKPG